MKIYLYKFFLLNDIMIIYIVLAIVHSLKPFFSDHCDFVEDVTIKTVMNFISLPDGHSDLTWFYRLFYSHCGVEI